MLLGLGVHTIVGGDAEDCGVGLAGAGNHVLHEVAVTWRVDDGEVVVGGEELLVSDVDGDASLALLLQSVHDVGEAESGLAHLGCQLLVAIDDVLFNVATV